MGVYGGYQKELFSKNDKGGIAIRYIGLIGPTVAILKPMFYKVSYYFDDDKVEDFETFYYANQQTHSGDIVSKSSFFDGIENSEFIPGIHVASALSFEYSTKDLYLNAFEIGISVDLFIDDVPIMFSENNNYQNLFTTLFISYRFGKVIDQRAYKNNKK